MVLERCYLTPEAKRAAKKKAADLNVNLIDLMDVTFLGDTRKGRKRGGDFDFRF